MGIEPTYPAWEAGVLPMNYIRKHYDYSTSDRELQVDFYRLYEFCSGIPRDRKLLPRVILRRQLCGLSLSEAQLHDLLCH